jgi:hypothetical protein
MIGLKLVLALGLGLIVAAAGVAWRINDSAYDRGHAARDAEAREIINRLEARLAERMKQNESKTDDEIDCELRRLRNPKAECGR